MSPPVTVTALGGDGRRLRLEVRGGPSSDNLAELLAGAGFPLNTRCGQRGICRGCMVEWIGGGLSAADGLPARPGTVRACQMKLAGGDPVIVEVARTARISESPLVGETVVVDVPFVVDPAIPLRPPRDTAFAIDLGTTTVVVLLVDLQSGEILSRAGAFNAQIRFGDNVITRIGAGADPGIRREMRRVLTAETLGPLIREALRRAGRDAPRLAGGVVAGNTTMLHILADEDTRPLGVAPFSARFLDGRCEPAEKFGLADAGIDGDLPVRLLPGFAAYVGADIVAGVHATGMTLDPEPGMLVDMGTNGEIVICADGRLIACATAAGPAFEGAGLTCGTRAHHGAISRIHIDHGLPAVETIGAEKATADTGICGSAYIDFLALARRQGWLRGNGRFESDAWCLLPEEFRHTEDGIRSILPAGFPGPRITEIDIAHLLQAKAAIAAGVEMMLATAGIKAADIGRLHLAGGFGMHLDVGHAIAIGLLPGFRSEQVRVVGNTSLAGAWLGAIDRQALVEMDAIRQRATTVELNELPDFEGSFIDHLSLP